MSDLEVVNPVPVDEARNWIGQLVIALLGDRYSDEFGPRAQRRERIWTPERTWGVRDGGRWVATLATEARRLTVPGGRTGTHDLDVDALTGVSVSATHRRRGLLREMIGRSLAAAVERGDAVTMLIAAEWPIYGRFGYAPATDLAEYRLRIRRPHPLLAPPPPGSVRMVEPEQLYEVAADLFEAARRARPGQVDRSPGWWERRLGQDGLPPGGSRPTWVVHDGPDGVDGMLGWYPTRDSDLADNLGAARVDDFVAANDTAYRDLLGYLGGLDLIDEIELPDRPVDEPIRWGLHNGRALSVHTLTDELWVRLLDVPAALTARGFAATDTLVLDVVDPSLGGYGAGRVRLDAGPDGAQCTRTDAEPDLRLDQRALAAIYLGGHSLRAVSAGDPAVVEELTPGAIDRTDALFAVALAPWTQTGF